MAHERALKAQAKKMNVDSLRSNQVILTMCTSFGESKNLYLYYFFGWISILQYVYCHPRIINFENWYSILMLSFEQRDLFNDIAN